MSTYAPPSRENRQLLPPGPTEDMHLASMRNDPLGFVTSMARQYGDITAHHTDTDTVFMLNRPDLACQVLRDRGERYSKVNTPDDRMLRPLLGNGLLTSSGDEWARQRRLCAPAFRLAEVTRFDGAIVKAAVRMTERWTRDGADIDIDAELTSFTLTVLIRAILGAEVDGIGPGFSRAVANVNRYIGHYVPAEDPDPADTRYRRLGFLQAKALLESVCQALIASRRAGTDGGDLVGRLLAMCSDVELRDQVLTLVMAGHETTAKALTWTLHLLDQHPHELDRVQLEVESVLGGRLPTAEDMPKLIRCQQVIKESMRLYPPVWLISRRAVLADVLDGYSVPPGTLVCVSQWVLHRHPDYWQRPLEFLPDRFTEAALRHHELPSHLYLPFGGGDRICIGQHLAMLEATLGLAVIVQRVRLRSLPDATVEPEALVTLRPRNGMHMTVIPR